MTFEQSSEDFFIFRQERQQFYISKVCGLDHQSCNLTMPHPPFSYRTHADQSLHENACIQCGTDFVECNVVAIQRQYSYSEHPLSESITVQPTTLFCISHVSTGVRVASNGCHTSLLRTGSTVWSATGQTISSKLTFSHPHQHWNVDASSSKSPSR